MTKPNDRDRPNSPRDGKPAARTAAACPVCGKPAAPAAQPFCSKRCAQLDLGRWLTGSYRVPTDEPADPSDLPREDDE